MARAKRPHSKNFLVFMGQRNRAGKNLRFPEGSFARTLGVGNMIPWRTASGQPERGVAHHSIILGRSAGLGFWNQILDLFPLDVAEFKTVPLS